jgi:hypothetical protein
MPSDDSSVRDALNHQSLPVSRDDPRPRPSHRLSWLIREEQVGVKCRTKRGWEGSGLVVPGGRVHAANPSITP